MYDRPVLVISSMSVRGMGTAVPSAWRIVRLLGVSFGDHARDDPAVGGYDHVREKLGLISRLGSRILSITASGPDRGSRAGRAPIAVPLPSSSWQAEHDFSNTARPRSTLPSSFSDR